MRVAAGVYLASGPSTCLAAPPAADEEAAGGDAGARLSACGNARIDIAYVSRFAVQPDGYGYAEMRWIGLVINSGEGLLDPAALEIIDSSVDDDLSVLAFGTFDRDGPPIHPGEARGELSSGGRDLVLASVSEDWTDPSAPELSGAITTARLSGELHGNVVVALGPHRISLDLELELTGLGGPGAVPQLARRSSSTCVDGS